MNKGKRCLICDGLVIVIAMLISSMLAGCLSARGKSLPRLTLMIYMSGSDLESRNGQGSEDIREIIENYPANAQLNILLMASGSTSWNNEIDSEASNIYRITESGLTLLEKNPLLNMGSAGTLSHLLAYGYENFPADEYALLLWDHGGGPMLGVCFDELHTIDDVPDSLSLKEIAEACNSSPFQNTKLEWIGFDACLMASVETATMLSPFAKYMIASEELEPAGGWNYSFINQLATTLDGMEIGKNVIDAYAASYRDGFDTVCMSLIDLSEIDKLNQGLSAMFSDIDPSEENYVELCRTRQETTSVARAVPYNYDLVDITDLVNNLSDVSHNQEVISSLEKSIVYSYSNDSNLHGMSIYYPQENWEKYISPWSACLDDMNVVSDYRTYIRRLSNIYSGSSLYVLSEKLQIETDASAPNTIIANVSNDLLSNAAGYKFVVFEEKGHDNYYKVFEDPNVQANRVGQLKYSYGGEALYLVDDTDTIQTDALTYEYLDQSIIATPVFVYNVSESRKDGRHPTWQILTFRQMDNGDIIYDKSYEQVEATGMFTDNSDGIESFSSTSFYDAGMWMGKNSSSIEDWEVYTFASWGTTPTYSDDGDLLPYHEWDESGLMQGVELVDQEIGKLRMMPILDGYDRYAYFEIYDFQGNTYCTPLEKLNNPNRVDVDFEGEQFASWEDVELKVEDINLRFYRGEETTLSILISVTGTSEGFDLGVMANDKDIKLDKYASPRYWFWEQESTVQYKEIEIPLSNFTSEDVETLQSMVFEIYHHGGEVPIKEIELSLNFDIGMFAELESE